MEKICVATGTRAEYGLLRSIMKRLKDDIKIDFRLVVTGMHLSPEFGLTINEILDDGFFVDEKIECIVSSDTTVGMTKSTALAMLGFAEYFDKTNPDVVVILGDRYEMFACATAAAMARIPIAHLYGGDTTEGAIDEFLRHSITKMSYLHFVSNESSKNRVEQLGESPDRVFNVGSTGVENIINESLLGKKELEASLNFDFQSEYALVTFHPVTMEETTGKIQMLELLKAIDQFPEMRFIFTKANADAEGRSINAEIDSFVKGKNNCIAFDSLGMLRYLSTLKYAKMIIGNSSSGIYEAPSFRVPTINIGDRQRGRLQAKSVINSQPNTEDIMRSMKKAMSQDFKNIIKTVVNPYQGVNTSSEIVSIIKETLGENKIDAKKKFHDFKVETK